MQYALAKADRNRTKQSMSGFEIIYQRISFIYLRIAILSPILFFKTENQRFLQSGCKKSLDKQL
ncbi:hypothetical protein GXM_02673 [Nostoc sphaeroides CCNUC1]|uniref:Uncharacterized protein n=1 Tax=Nostoc sphaeroides CCNUC1 TaxID=2653204 RepID=A0A5P8VYJ9_9NOSO|nr:hypothetical protein GXM_02673 [Nostoc sphaeroides CCNUC1]